MGLSSLPEVFMLMDVAMSKLVDTSIYHSKAEAETAAALLVSNGSYLAGVCVMGCVSAVQLSTSVLDSTPAS
jgi:hypothetical protein